MKLIGYVRVSTERQGRSGLGLDAQMTAIQGYAKRHEGELLATYREVESGRRADRPELTKAIQHAKRVRGRLIIAKLDRLARNTHFISGLTDAKIDFACCDYPDVNKLTIHILAAVAEDEAERISERTKAALAALKARGEKLGSARDGHWKGKEHLRQKAILKAAKTAKANRDKESLPIYLPAVRLAKPMHDQGATLQGIADKLNAEGMTTLRGCPWNPVQVRRLLASGLAAALVACPVMLTM